MAGSIFVSIASYRDPDLGPTIADCLAKAGRPERLRFGVCWQHADDEPRPACLDDPRVRVLDVDWRESRGGCWARSRLQECFAGEDWYLQLDSHHRFAPDWDLTLEEQARISGSPAPVLTSFAPGFDLSSPGQLDPQPYRIEFDRFREDGIPMLRAGLMGGWQDRPGPLRGRFLCGHLIFAPGSFVTDVPMDPDLYTTEETMMAIRAFTHGYDLWQPSRTVVWHAYSRDQRQPHWDDRLDQASRRRTLDFLASPWVGPLGCGRTRTFAEYEAYAGISFSARKVQDYTRLGLEPPNPQLDPDWPSGVRERRLEIEIARERLPAGAVEDADFWYVGFHDGAGRELFRQDAAGDELRRLLARGSSALRLTRTFESMMPPASWCVIPHSASRGWLAAVGGSLEQE